MATILIAGCGYVGTALGLRLAGAGHAVWGLRRSAEQLPAPIRPFPADLSEPRTLRDLPADIEIVFYTAGPDGYDREAYEAAYVQGPRHLLRALAEQRQQPKRIFFTSSTGVYGQSRGEWVDESSPTEPGTWSGKLLLEGERTVLRGPIPATILRLGGLYGPGRRRLIEQVAEGEARCPEGAPRYSNRIHRDDVAGALAHLMELPAPVALYLGVDHEPTPRCTIYRWIAEQLELPPPPTDGSSTRRRGSNKRCRNERLVASGYHFLYPTFREGYHDLLDPSP